MALETATFISQLVDTDPVHTDGLNQADAHLRLIKSCLLATFPNFTAAALNSTNAEIDVATVATSNAGTVSPTSGTMLIPAGAVMYFAAAIPAGWLACDGSSYSTTTYAALFNAIGYTYGGSGGNFNVPDAGGRAIAGVDTVSGRLAGAGFASVALGGTGGAATHTLTTAELASHNHGISDPGHTHTVNDPGHTHTISDPGHAHGFTQGDSVGTATNVGQGGFDFASGGTAFWFASSTTSVGTGITINGHVANVSNDAAVTGISTTANGSGTAHLNVQPTLILNVAIKT